MMVDDKRIVRYRESNLDVHSDLEVGWFVVLRIYVASAIFQPYRDLEAGDYQSLKFKWRGWESNSGLLLRKPRA